MSKRESCKQKNGLLMELVPGDGGDLKNAYIRLESNDGYYVGAFDRDDLKSMRKLKEWVDKIIEANEK
jgi:hypothetical protein